VKGPGGKKGEQKAKVKPLVKIRYPEKANIEGENQGLNRKEN
jgi:hypothetical protein